MAEGDLWFFDRVAPVYHVLMPAAKASVLRAGLDQASRPLDRVIDLGGGTGRAAMAVDRLEPVVMDASRGMLKRAPLGLRLVQANATTLPVATASIDAILVVDAFHHLPAHNMVLEELERVLRPGGVVVIRDFDPTSRRGRALEIVEHLIRMRSRFLSSSAVTDRLEDVGFETSIVESGFAFTVVGRKPGAQ